MGYINPQKMRFAAYGQFVLVYQSSEKIFYIDSYRSKKNISTRKQFPVACISEHFLKIGSPKKIVELLYCFSLKLTYVKTSKQTWATSRTIEKWFAKFAWKALNSAVKKGKLGDWYSRLLVHIVWY